MKRGIIVFLVLVVVVGALAGGWWWARTSPEQAIQFLVDGGLEATRAEEFVVRLGGRAEPEDEQSMVVSGSIEGEEVTIVSEFGGRIIGLYVDEGDQVEFDQVLVELDTSLLQAQMAQAEAAVVAAEANLANVRAGTHPAEVMAAQAALRQAIAGRSAAETAWQDTVAVLGDPQEINTQIVEARAALDLATVQIEQAEAQHATAKVERDRYRAQGSMEEKWLYRVYEHQVQAAYAGLQAARENRKGAVATLRELEALRENPLALVSQVHLAEAQAALAQAGVAVATARTIKLV